MNTPSLLFSLILVVGQAEAQPESAQPEAGESAESAQPEIDEPETRGPDAAFFGGEWESRGEIASENRAFLDDDDPATVDQAVGLFARLELSHEHGIWSQRARVLGRVDARDAERATMIVEELWAQMKTGPLRLRVGADILNWTATEAFHPADVINARNLDSDVENYEKVGEPMVALQVTPFSGTTLDVFYFPAFMKPVLASRASRLSPIPPGIELGGRILLDRQGSELDSDFGPQGALRLRQKLGEADVSVHVIEHMDRSQPLVAVRDGEAHLLFLTVLQAGATYQQVVGFLIAKLEGSFRHFYQPDVNDLALPFVPERDHGTLAVGFEYGIPHDDGGESTLLLEGQTIVGVREQLRQELSPFQRDVLVGYRLALNDEDSREVLLTAIVDLEHAGELMASASYQQRIGETWAVRVSARLFHADEPDAFPVGLQSLREADFVRLILTRYF